MKLDLISEILDHGREDWVDFAEVMSIVRSRTSLPEPAAILMSVELIGDMLNQQSVLVGDLQKREGKIVFSPWNRPPKLIVERIQNDLATLGHRPGIGEICWLSTI